MIENKKKKLEKGSERKAGWRDRAVDIVSPLRSLIKIRAATVSVTS